MIYLKEVVPLRQYAVRVSRQYTLYGICVIDYSTSSTYVYAHYTVYLNGVVYVPQYSVYLNRE